MIEKVLGFWILLTYPLRLLWFLSFFAAIFLCICFMGATKNLNPYNQIRSQIKINEHADNLLKEVCDIDNNCLLTLTAFNSDFKIAAQSYFKHFDQGEMENNKQRMVFIENDDPKDLPIYLPIQLFDTICFHHNGNSTDKILRSLKIKGSFENAYICRNDNYFMILFTSKEVRQVYLKDFNKTFDNIYKIAQYGSSPSFFVKFIYNLVDYVKELWYNNKDEVKDYKNKMSAMITQPFFTLESQPDAEKDDKELL